MGGAQGVGLRWPGRHFLPAETELAQYADASPCHKGFSNKSAMSPIPHKQSDEEQAPSNCCMRKNTWLIKAKQQN